MVQSLAFLYQTVTMDLFYINVLSKLKKRWNTWRSVIDITEMCHLFLQRICPFKYTKLRFPGNRASVQNSLFIISKGESCVIFTWCNIWRNFSISFSMIVKVCWILTFFSASRVFPRNPIFLVPEIHFQIKKNVFLPKKNTSTRWNERSMCESHTAPWRTPVSKLNERRSYT